MRGRATRLTASITAAATTLAVVAIASSSGPEAGDERAAERLDRGSARGPASTHAAVAHPPVVMLVLDEFPTDLLLDRHGRIDAVRYPAFAKLASNGYWFPNATTTYDSTAKAVPQILDAKLPRKGASSNYLDHPRSVYDLFGRRGYRIESSEEATAICPPRHCPGARPDNPGTLSRLARGRDRRLDRFIASVRRTKRPTFRFKHVLLPHGPYLYLPSGKQMRRGAEDPVSGINGVPGFHDPFLALHAQQRLQLQIGWLDRKLGELLRRMRRQGIFERSLIVVTADHGISSEHGVSSRRRTDLDNIDELAPVPLFVKAPGQRRGRTLPSYVRTVDIVPTMADLLGMRMPYRADGRSAFSRAMERRRTVRVIKRDFSGSIVVSARVMERRRRALLKRRLRRFGSGDLARLYSGIGPHRRLIGRRMAELTPEAAGKARALIAGGRDMAAVDPRSELLPTQVAGAIEGGEPERGRDLAVAVNGRIEAVGRSFHLRGSPRESFSMVVPERSMRPGRNVVEVLEVLDRGSRLRLLGRN